MGNEEKDKWMKRIHRFLREKAIVELAWMPDASGSYADDTGHILVNPFFEFVRILLHEAIHGVDPDMTEQDVLQMESQLFENLTDRQILYLISRYMLAEDGGEIPFRRTKFGLDL